MALRIETEDDTEIELPTAGPMTVDGALITELDDGGVEIDLDPQPEIDTVEAKVHGANLAMHLPNDVLNALSSSLLEGVEQDKNSRAEWEEAGALGIKLMGLQIEQRTKPFSGACGVYDPLMAEAVVRWQSNAMAELMPAKGPTKTQIAGVETPALAAQASRVEAWMNLYLTQRAPEYYEEKDQMLMWLPLVGSTFVEVYQDPNMRRPVARFHTPEKVIVPYGATDLESCPRYAVVKPQSRRQIKLSMINGFYRTVPLDEPVPQSRDDAISEAVDESQGVENSADVGETYDVYEVRCDLNLEGFEHKEDLPLPYIVSIEKETQQVLSVRRNWREGDPGYERKSDLIHYKFMPGFGFYGIGYAHLLGNSAMTATMGTRNVLDAATLANFPGGVRTKGVRFEDDNFTIAPGQFKEVDTGGQPLQNVFMPLPYKGADPTLFEATKAVRENARGLASTTEISVGEGRQDAPVGTTVALMEAANLVRSGTIRRCHRALGKELKAIADLFGENLGDEPYPFPVRGGQQMLMKADFSSNIDVIPVSDPSAASSTERKVRAEGVVRMAGQFPQQHNLQAALTMFYTEMGYDAEVTAMLVPPPPKPEEARPLDPLSENMNAMVGKPLVAGDYQDHDAHIAAHMPIAERNPSVQAHINEHIALQMRARVQQMIGQPLPPMGQPLPPQIENQLAVMVAQAMQQLAPMYKPKAAEDAIVEVEREKVQAKREADVLKAQTALQVAQVNAAVDDKKILVDSASEAADRQTRIAIAAMGSGERR
jgi:hypothetical protein